jgi:hypothetical protein
VRLAIANPMVMIASDGITEHPRSAGTYARVLGKYVREEKALTLMDAIRKSSLMPAQRLEGMSAAMRKKGRVKVGSDADLSVFDPKTVIDKSTFDKPAQYSEGVPLCDGWWDVCGSGWEAAGWRAPGAGDTGALAARLAPRWGRRKRLLYRRAEGSPERVDYAFG